MWILPLALIIALAAVMYLIPALETAPRTPVEGSADWMKPLPDGLSISEVILPGTHDSATENVQLAFFSKCQSLSIGEQLEAGFRYLDIRLGEDEEGLKLMHGFVSCLTGPWPWSGALRLENVLEECYSFLDAHPTEFVVFCVKHEHGEASDADFMGMLMEEIEKTPERWYLGSVLPTVGEARGRLVLLRRTKTNELPGVSFKWKEQKGYEDPSLNVEANTCPSLTLLVQDRFEYDAEEKWAAFTAGIDASEPGPDTVALNFLSAKGHAKYGHPYKFARELNARLTEENAVGWVVIDFGSPELAKTIYGANFR